MNQDILNDIDDVMDQALATGLFRSLMTVQAPTGALGAGGAPVGTRVNVPGLVDIVCMDAPEFEEAWRISAEEHQRSDQVMSVSQRHVLLDRYYALLSPVTNWGDVGWSALLTDRTGNVTEYDIVGADADSQQTMTRVALEKANPAMG